MKRKCVFTIGPESSGSMLVARICAHVLGVAPFGQWNGVGWCDQGRNKVCHRSLPFCIPPRFPDIGKWIADNESDYDIHFVLTTRDITLSEISRVERFNKSFEQVRSESLRAKEIMSQIIASEQKHLIWSYETFMFLGQPYLSELYRFLEVESDFEVPLKDGNRYRLEQLLKAPEAP